MDTHPCILNEIFIINLKRSLPIIFLFVREMSLFLFYTIAFAVFYTFIVSENLYRDWRAQKCFTSLWLLENLQL